jgi:hypothetical protein
MNQLNFNKVWFLCWQKLLVFKTFEAVGRSRLFRANFSALKYRF